MLATAVAPEIQNFWAPVSQIVPVFALALVIEARRLALGWNAENKLERRIIPLAFIIAALALYFIESEALNRMLSGQHDDLRARWVIFGLLLAATGIGVQPIYNLVVIANIDLIRSVARSMPWTPIRKVRRSMQVILDDYSVMAKQQLRQAGQMDELLERSRSNLTDRKSSLAEVNAMLAVPDLAPEVEEQLTTLRKKIIKELPIAAKALSDVGKQRRNVQRETIDLDRQITKLELWVEGIPGQVKEAEAADFKEGLEAWKQRLK
jgi:hypothetical protein